MSPITPTTANFPQTAATFGNGHTGTLAANVAWWPDRALQVDLVLNAAGQPPQRWLIARDLLNAGLDAPAGLGDVSILPDLPADGCRVEIVLRDHRGIGNNLALVLPVAALRRFLTHTYRRVPAGAENYAFDMAELSGEATS